MINEIPSKRTENFIAFGRSNIWPSVGDEGQNMLSFSSSEPHCQNENFSRTTGVLNEGMLVPFARLKGPFSPLKWTELERQALIYKHIVANVPMPSNLLVPLRSPLNPYASSGSRSSDFLGWGPFHLGFSSSNDPEPGRCRRTDGKKWRCSRDAVPDQKYCERHINRGRHRPRKPVEGQTGHAVSESTTTSVAPIASSSSAMVMSSSSTSNSHAMEHKPNFLQLDTVDLINRLSRELDLIQMSLGVSNDIGESLKKQLKWLPVSWENLMGGPLRELLTSTSISVGAGTNLSSLKAYESSPQLDSAPNGVLQKSTFVSLSNSSGSSHIAANRSAPKNANLRHEIDSAIPSL